MRYLFLHDKCDTNKVLSYPFKNSLCGNLALSKPSIDRRKVWGDGRYNFESRVTVDGWEEYSKKIQISSRFQRHCSLFTKLSFERTCCKTPQRHVVSFSRITRQAPIQLKNPKLSGNRQSRLLPPCCRGRFPIQGDLALRSLPICPPGGKGAQS